MSVDIYFLKNLVVGCMRALTLRANYGNDIPCVAQRACFAPDASIKRHRKIFDDDTDRCSLSLLLSEQLSLIGESIHNFYIRRVLAGFDSIDRETVDSSLALARQLRVVLVKITWRLRSDRLCGYQARLAGRVGSDLSAASRNCLCRK